MSTPAPSPKRLETGARGRFGWVMFDWANQPFFALGTFIFAPYFATGFVGDAARGQELWGYMLGAAGLTVAFLSPFLGAAADAVGRRKAWIFVFTIPTVVGSLVIWLAAPGETHLLVPILIAYAMALVSAEFATVFNNAMLPSLARDDAMGRLSGIGWAMGYAGGLIALIFILLTAVLPDAPLFGLDPAAREADRIVGPFAAVWLVVFLIPFFLWTPDVPHTGRSFRQGVGEGVARLRATVAKVRRYKNIVRFLVARMLYQDGLTAILSFGGIYGAGVFDWDITTLGLFAIILIAVSVPGCLIGGVIDDRLGAKTTVLMAVTGLIIGTLGVLSVGPDTVFFVVPVDPVAADGGPFASAGEQVFLAFGVIIGFCVGPGQAASRTLMARLAPAGMVTEFFGLYAFAGKATAFLAPILIATVTAYYAAQRPGLAVVLVLLVAGLLLLIGVREERAVPLEREAT
ncbi:MAG: MFS transporter [Devosia sp.]